MVGQIGFIAGDIYSHLSTVDGATLSQLKTALKQPPSMIQLAVGWLTREGKVEVVKKGSGFRVSRVD